jgi:outer membrane protein OmpA-like peptidoglycan-associated protein
MVRQVIRRLFFALAAAASMLMLSPAHAWTPFLVFFDTGSTVINTYGGVVLDNAAGSRRQLDVRRYTVIGHADRVGAAEANLRLSRRRAEAVRAALIARGVPAEIIRIEPMGETRPLVSTADEVAEGHNRYAEVILAEMCKPPPGWGMPKDCEQMPSAQP